MIEFLERKAGERSTQKKKKGNFRQSSLFPSCCFSASIVWGFFLHFLYHPPLTASLLHLYAVSSRILQPHHILSFAAQYYVTHYHYDECHPSEKIRQTTNNNYWFVLISVDGAQNDLYVIFFVMVFKPAGLLFLFWFFL